MNVRGAVVSLLMGCVWLQTGYSQEPVSFEAISQAVSKSVINAAAREFVLCHFRAALWGGYNAQARVGANATVDSRPRIFRIAAGRFLEEIDPAGISGLASRTREGIVSIPTQEAAFAKGVPFYVSNVVLDSPKSLRYTCAANPNVRISGQVFSRLDSAVGSGRSDVLLDLLSPSSQPQEQSSTLSAAPSESGDDNFGIITNTPVGNTPVLCVASNEFNLQNMLFRPSISAGGVVNAASFLPGPVAPGEIVTIFGSRIGPATLTQLRLTPAGLVDNTLAETRVLFDGTRSPLIYVQAGQVSALAPYSLAGKGTTQLEVEFQGKRSAAVTLPVAQAAPGLFTLDSSGKGPGAILNGEDGTVNSASNAVARGSIAVLYATGEGQTEPPGVDGKPVTEPLPKPRLPVSVRIGGLEAEVLYAGGAPGLVAGVLQVNVRVPHGVTPGNAVPVLLTVGNAPSQPAVTLAVK